MESSKTIFLYVISGKFTTNQDWFGDQDPYVKFEYNGVKYKTSVKSDAGKSATWNEKFKLDGVSKSSQIQL